MILAVGMMVCDTFIHPVPENIFSLDTCEIDRVIQSPGGDALNVASALSKLGFKTAVAGRIGDDTAGDFILSKCRNLKIDISGVRISRESSTAQSFVLIDKNGERHFLSNIEIFNEISDEDVDKNLIESADVIYIGSICSMRRLDNGGAAKILKRAKYLNKITFMDAAINKLSSSENWLNTLSEALKNTDYFFPSLKEAVEITGKKDLEEIAECFRKFRMKGFGIKLGRNGCFVTDFAKTEVIPAVKTEVVDTTGAGDTFMAAFIAGVLRGSNIFESAKFATRVAAHSISYVGATSGIEIFKNNFK